MANRHSWLGPFLIGFAAVLWATDTLFRLPAVSAINPVIVVALEHLVAVLVLTPWIILKQRKKITQLSAKEWTAAVLIGAGASAVATVLFTGSFRYINPSITILLQKLQPVIVVFTAYLFLGESPKPKFFLWACLALVAGLVLSFPTLNFSFLHEGFSLQSKGVLFALGAAIIWALSTVAGKALLRKQPTSVTTYWRYVFGLITLVLIIMLGGLDIPFHTIGESKNLIAISYMGLIPGLLAMLAYYKGLSSTQASVGTFVELLFPVSAVAINAWFLNMPLSWVQIVAGSVLIFCVTRISGNKK